ncbi:MAG: hypothetical protein JXQ29_13240 [Planctomycetes bacterium]|nr:hypothetical protein [Planctomycetota bacterium]
MAGRQAHGGRGRNASRSRFGLGLVLGLGVLGCVTTTRRVTPDLGAVLAASGLEIEVPPGWHLEPSPLHFLDSTLLHLMSPDGLAVAIEVSRGDLADPEAHVQHVLERYGRAYPQGRFHPVREAIGPYETHGFDGVVFQPDESGQRLNLLYRCFGAEGRITSFQGQAPAAVWSARRDELRRALATYRVHPRRRPTAR